MRHSTRAGGDFKLNGREPAKLLAQKRQTVLVVIHGDGFVEVFADPHTDVRIIEQPWMTTAEGERLAETYVDLTLPRRYRNLYWPNNRRAVAMIEGVTPAELARREADRDLSRSLDRVAGILNPDEDEGRVWTL